MNGMDRQLRDLLEAAAGEPPRRVSVEAVHRRVIRRRVVEVAAGAVALAAIAALIPVGIGALGRGPGPSTTGPAAARMVTSGHYGYTETLPAGWRLVRQATRQWNGTGGPGYDTTRRGPVRRTSRRPGLGATRHQRRRACGPTRQRSSGPPAPPIRARRRKPTRRSRSAGHPPGWWACNARQAAVSWWRSRSPSTTAPGSCSHPSPRRGPPGPTSLPPPSANSWLASGFHRKGSPTRDHATRAPIVTPEAVTTAPISCPYWARNPAKTWPSHHGDHDVPKTANRRQRAPGAPAPTEHGSQHRPGPPVRPTPSRGGS